MTFRLYNIIDAGGKEADIMLHRKMEKEIYKWINSSKKALLIDGDYVKIGLNQEKPYK